MAGLGVVMVILFIFPLLHRQDKRCNKKQLFHIALYCPVLWRHFTVAANRSYSVHGAQSPLALTLLHTNRYDVEVPFKLGCSFFCLFFVNINLL